MPDFGVNLGRRERKIQQQQQQNCKPLNKNLNDLKLKIFLELVHLDLYSGKVWENRFFSILDTLSRSLQQTALNRGVTANRG